MKGFIFAILLISIAFAKVDSVETFTDYIKGLLASINEKGKVEDLKNCIKDGDAILVKVKTGLEAITTMDSAKITVGLKSLFEGTTDMLEMLKACDSAFTTLLRIGSEISKADISRLVKKVLSNPGSFFHLAINGLESLNKKDFVGFGSAVGTIEKMLLLQRVEQLIPFVDFIKGFFEGINETGDVNKLMECLKEGEAIMQKIMQALEYIMKFDIQNVMKGIQLIMEVVHELSEKLKPCAEGYKQLEKLFEAVKNADIIQVVMKIMSHSSSIIADITDCIEMFKKGNYEKSGRDLGNILFIIFLAK